MVPLGTTPRLEDHGPTCYAESRNVTELLLDPTVILLCFGLEERLSLSVPDDEAGRGVLVTGCPVVLEVDARKCVMSGVVAVKGLIMIEEITFSDLDKF